MRAGGGRAFGHAATAAVDKAAKELDEAQARTTAAKRELAASRLSVTEVQQALLDAKKRLVRAQRLARGRRGGTSAGPRVRWAPRPRRCDRAVHPVHPVPAPPLPRRAARCPHCAPSTRPAGRQRCTTPLMAAAAAHIWLIN